MKLNMMDVHRWTGPLLGALSLAGVALLSFGLYLQHVQGLEPCPMCIVQRYAWVLVTLLAAAAALAGARLRSLLIALMGLAALLGAGVAARQTWLQWFAPEVFSCGRDLFGMIESFPLKRVIPMVFKGSGDCSSVDWTFLGLTIANWSLLCFVGVVGLAVAMWLAQRQATKGVDFS